MSLRKHPIHSVEGYPGQTQYPYGPFQGYGQEQAFNTEIPINKQNPTVPNMPNYQMPAMPDYNEQMYNVPHDQTQQNPYFGFPGQANQWNQQAPNFPYQAGHDFGYQNQPYPVPGQGAFDQTYPGLGYQQGQMLPYQGYGQGYQFPGSPFPGYPNQGYQF